MAGAAKVHTDLRPGPLRHLEFEQPDFERFPCLRLAFEAAEKGGAHCIALNAADEVAVGAFLERRIPFTGIPGTIEKVLASTPEAHPATIAEVLAADQEARQMGLGVTCVEL